jgi:hypothetical protein
MQMIVPYLATILLIVVTAYSAIVSFRQRPEGEVPSWLFPDGTSRRSRILVGVLTLALVVGVVGWASIATRNSPRRSLRFLSPENYSGWVRVEFDVAGAEPLPIEAGQAVVKLPASAALATSSPEQFGWAKDFYFYSTATGLRPLPSSGPGRMIWGKITAEESGASGKRKYEEFFVGTEKQFRDEAGSKPSLAPSPVH